MDCNFYSLQIIPLLQPNVAVLVRLPGVDSLVATFQKLDFKFHIYMGVVSMIIFGVWI